MADTKTVTNVKVEFFVTTGKDVDSLYLVGSDAKVGAWDETKAVKLEYNPAKGAFYASKMIKAGTVVEFKILSDKSWANVEKGYYGEEVPNRVFTAEKGAKVIVDVQNFA